jgi:hypothetical protein
MRCLLVGLMVAGCGDAPPLANPPADAGSVGDSAGPADAPLPSPDASRLPQFEALPLLEAGPVAAPTDARSLSPAWVCPLRGCTVAQKEAYALCILDRCDSPYQACLGPGYRSGVYAEPCGDFVACLDRCPCEDVACHEACRPSPDCQSCLSNRASQCGGASLCTPPVCTPSPPPLPDAGLDAPSSCDDLLRCCAALSSADQRVQCNMAYASVKTGGDAACGGLLSIYRANHLCP